MDGHTPNTTWFRYISFPLFILNSIQALGNVREGAGEEVAEPGRPVVLHAETTGRTITVSSPADGRPPETCRGRRRGRSSTTRPTRPAFTWPDGSQRDCCRSRSTSSTRARATWPRAGSFPKALQPAGRSVQDQDRLQPRHGHPEAGGHPERHLVVASRLLALGVLLVEWYIYNRRVYI